MVGPQFYVRAATQTNLENKKGRQEIAGPFAWCLAPWLEILCEAQDHVSVFFKAVFSFNVAAVLQGDA